jgi:hypothetical protein
MDMAYMFSAPRQGIDESVADQLRAAADEWQREHVRSRPSQLDLGDEIVLISRRRRFDWTVLQLRDPVELAAFRLLDQPHTPAALVRKLAGAATDAGVEALLARWRELGIVFTDAGQYVHIAPAANNEELLRFEQHFAARPDIGPSDRAEPVAAVAA